VKIELVYDVNDCLEGSPVLDESNQLIGAINLTDLLQLELSKEIKES